MTPLDQSSRALPVQDEPREPVSPSGTVFWNFLAVGSGEAIARLVAFAGLLYVARVVGATGYGIIAFLATITLYTAKVADFGIETIGSSEIARHRDDIPRLASAILTMRLAIASLLVLGSIAAAQLLAEPERTLFSIFALTLLPIAASTKWIHLGLEAARPVGVWRVIGEVITLLVILSAVRGPGDIWRVPVANLLGDVVVAGVLYWLVLRRHRLGFRWDPGTAVPVFKRAVPIVGQFLAGLLIYNSDIIFLRVLGSAEAVGYYAAAYTLLSFIANISTMYGLTLLPTLVRLGKGTIPERALYHTALAQVFAVALPVAVGGMFLAPAIIRLVFGQAYSSSGVILQLLVWAVLPFTLRVVPWAALIAHGHQALVWRANAIAAVANLGLNLVLIHAYGGLGAAAATIATELLAGCFTFFYIGRRGLSIAPLQRFWRPVLAAIAMAATLWVIREAHFGIRLAVGAGTYGLVLFSVGALRFRSGVPILAV